MKKSNPLSRVRRSNAAAQRAQLLVAFDRSGRLFFGSEEAGERSAEIYTLIANCRMHGVEPHAYLKDGLQRLPRTTNRHVAELTPLAWKKARQQAHRKAA